MHYFLAAFPQKKRRGKLPSIDRLVVVDVSYEA